MAESYPAIITESYFMRDDGQPDLAEWQVFSRLRESLPADWLILPRVHWFWKENRGECDFIVINPFRDSASFFL